MHYDVSEKYKRFRTLETYMRMVGTAIALRELDKELYPYFTLCIPREYLPSIAKEYPNYQYAILGGCFTVRDEMFVRWTKCM